MASSSTKSIASAALLFLASLLGGPSASCLALNVLVVGGSGRVGGSTVRWLRTLSERRGRLASVTAGGRREGSYDAAVRSGVLPPGGEVDFLSLDVDGDASEVRRSLERWRDSRKGRSASSTTSGESGDDDDDDPCLVVHTGGPFQGRRSPTLLSACIDLKMPYVDVCDEWELAEASKSELDEKARDAGVPAVVSCGIWPGVSALMAAEGVAQLKASAKGSSEEEVEIESIDYSFFTAGTGNAGPTIVSATFLLLATPAITFFGGKRTDAEPWTERRDVDFGKGVGSRPVWLLDNPDVPTTALYVTKGTPPNCSSRFGTAPLFWNYLFGAMKALPRSLLYDRDAMQTFSLFSEPIIRLVDKLVGATNAMRVDVAASEGGEKRRRRTTLRIAHPDLEQCVGLATAAFALEVADSFGSEGATVEPGVWFPVELG
ncbi:hypothetical protein ACHAWF_010339, partial [Thalassiosira exigua]